MIYVQRWEVYLCGKKKCLHNAYSHLFNKQVLNINYAQYVGATKMKEIPFFPSRDL